MRLSLATVFLAMALLAHLALALVAAGPWNALLACGLYAWTFVLAFRRHPVLCLLLSPLAMLHLSVLVSLIAVESGARMREVGFIGHPSPASALYGLLIAMFLAAALGVGERLQRRWAARPGTARIVPLDRHALLLRWLPLVFGVLAISWLLLKGARTGFPLLAGYDRFGYRAAVGDPITLNLLNLKVVIAAFLGVAALRCASPRGRWPYHLLFALYLLTSFLFGDKFFIIIAAALVYLAIQSIDDPAQLRRRLRLLLPLALLVVLVAAAVTVYVYSGRGQLGWQVTSQKLFDRIASQAQLWFLAVEHGFSWANFQGEQLRLNLQSLVETPAQDFVFQERLGPFYFIDKYATAQKYWSFVGNQGYVAPIMVWDGYLLELFGLAGLLPGMLLTGALAGAVLAWLAAGVRSRNPYNVLLPAHVFVQVSYLVVSGTPANLLSVGSFKAYGAMLALQLLVWVWTRRTGNTDAILRRRLGQLA